MVVEGLARWPPLHGQALFGYAEVVMESGDICEMMLATRWAWSQRLQTQGFNYGYSYRAIYSPMHSNACQSLSPAALESKRQQSTLKPGGLIIFPILLHNDR
jgi:hypothetical protein